MDSALAANIMAAALRRRRNSLPSLALARSPAIGTAITMTAPVGGWCVNKHIRLHGGVYRGVANSVPSRENPNVRQDARGFRYLNDIPARSPQDRR